jgi:hypothetical protein
MAKWGNRESKKVFMMSSFSPFPLSTVSPILGWALPGTGGTNKQSNPDETSI